MIFLTKDCGGTGLNCAYSLECPEPSNRRVVIMAFELCWTCEKNTSCFRRAKLRSSIKLTYGICKPSKMECLSSDWNEKRNVRVNADTREHQSLCKGTRVFLPFHPKNITRTQWPTRKLLKSFDWISDMYVSMSDACRQRMTLKWGTKEKAWGLNYRLRLVQRPRTIFLR